MNVQHSSRTDAWGTPTDILNAARYVLGEIDFDPASSAAFNERVKAKRYYTEHDDALSKPWPINCSVYLNPPGGKYGGKSKTALFWDRLLAYRDEGLLRHAVFMAFSLEALQTTQRCREPMLRYPLCVPRKRIAFVTHDGLVGEAPSHSNCIVYVPGFLDERRKFKEAFSKFGECLEGQ